MTDRLIRGSRVSYLKFLGDDSGCSVENGFEKDRIACRGPGQAVVAGARNNWSGSGEEESGWTEGMKV